MKKKALLVAAGFIVAMFMGAGVAMADEVLPGAAIWQDSSVMGVGKTMMQIGAADRAATNRLNRASGAVAAHHRVGRACFGSSPSRPALAVV